MKNLSNSKLQLREKADCCHEDNSENLIITNILPDSNLPVAFVTDGFFVKPVGENIRVKVCYTDIVWVEAENTYSHIHLTSGKRVSVAHNIQRINLILPDMFFVRVSRSEIINIRKVWRYCGNTLYLYGCNRPFTVGKSFRGYTFSCFRELEK